MLAAIVLTYIAAFTAVVLRIVSRMLVKVRLGFDDYTAIAALVSSTPLFKRHFSNPYVRCVPLDGSYYSSSVSQ